MNKPDIINKIMVNHQKFATYISSLGERDFMFDSNGEKWTAGQQAAHICRSLAPLNYILALPKWISKFLFAKANRPSKTYDELLKKYLQKLDAGGKAPKQFIPGIIKPAEQRRLKNKMEHAASKLCKSLGKYSEEDLDKMVLPHPLLGRVNLREMLYFTAYHAEHHHKSSMRNLEGSI